MYETFFNFYVIMCKEKNNFKCISIESKNKKKFEFELNLIFRFYFILFIV